MGHIVHSADGKQDMARIQRPGRACTAGGCLDPLVVQKQEQGLSLNSLEAEIHISRKTLLPVSVQGGVRDLGKAVDQAVPELRDILGVLLHLRADLLQSRGHGADAGHILGACALSALLCAALDEVRDRNALSHIEESHALRPMELMGGGGQHVDVVVRHIDREVSDGLDRVRVEEDLLFAADRADLPDGLDRADLIIREHDGHETGIFPDGSRDLLRKDDPVFMDVQEGDVEAFFSQLFQRVQHCVMFKGSGDDVHLPLLFPKGCCGEDRLIVGLASAGGENDLLRLCSDHCRDRFSGLFQRFLCFLSMAVETGGIPPDLLHHGGHCPDRRRAHLCSSGVVCVNHMELLLSADLLLFRDPFLLRIFAVFF